MHITATAAFIRLSDLICVRFPTLKTGGLLHNMGNELLSMFDLVYMLSICITTTTAIFTIINMSTTCI